MSRVLLVDDDRNLCETLRSGLADRFQVETECDPRAALDRLRAEDFDVLVSDVHMPVMDGIELATRAIALRPDIPVIVFTAFGSLDAAVGAIRAGAYDFLSKPVKVDALAIALDRAIQRRALEVEVKRLRTEIDRSVLSGSEGLVGRSAAMRVVHDLVGRVASTDASVLITGESGTGKEVVARAIHKASPRADRPFVAINCAALPEALLESELFGHVRGAFTDARETRLGLLRQAEGGTIFLDEIGDMPLGLQPKLLRVLQERVVRPVGGQQEVPIDVRFVTATNRDLEGAIEERTFREDLFFRINVVNVVLPPLRARGPADILALAAQFLVRFAEVHRKGVTGFAPAAAERLVQYPWPGNVRELMNCVEHAVTLARFDQITLDDLPPRIAAARPEAPRWELPAELVSLDEIERRYIDHVLERTNGNKTASAKILRIERKTLYRKLQQWGIRGPEDR